MKSTVSVAFLMILAAYESNGQQDFWEPPAPLEPLSAFQAQQTPDVQPRAQPSVQAGDAPESGLQHLAVDLLMDMSTAAPGRNVIVSPYSVWSAMLVVYEGAEGQTATQIASTLQLGNGKPSGRSTFKRLALALQKANNGSHSDFASGNGIFYDGRYPPKPDFQRRALSDYQSQLQPVDFSRPITAAKTINDWVSDVTHERIKTIVTPRDIAGPELIITNALLFKGKWQTPFVLTATHTAEFYDETGQHIADVPMMYQSGDFMLSIIPELGAHVLDLPYEDTKFRMLVVMPSRSSSTVVEALGRMKTFPVHKCYERLENDRLRRRRYKAEFKMDVFLPRFKFGNSVELSENLQRLGIVDAFDSDNADLSSMSPQPLHLTKVLHAAEIDVTEEGTVASAATAAVVSARSSPPKFRANRPFAYFVVESSQKTVIFAGIVADPTKGSY